MKKILSIILITACLACGCSSASDTEKNASKSTASEPESIDFFAMDTTIKFSAYGDKKVLKGAKKVLTDLEKKVSVTDSGSEIYHINQNGSGTLTGDVSDLMQKALQMCTQTDGALDISIYPIVKAWGFTTGDYQVPDESTIQSLLPMVDYTKVEFDKTTGNVTIPSGMTIDLGSIAKGYAGQQSAQYLLDNGVKSALLNLGGNVQTIGSKPDGSPWKVGIKDPNGDTPMMVLSITDQAVITSGGYERYFEQDGHTYWHIMDPATGHPADSGRPRAPGPGCGSGKRHSHSGHQALHPLRRQPSRRTGRLRCRTGRGNPVCFHPPSPVSAGARRAARGFAGRSGSGPPAPLPEGPRAGLRLLLCRF